MSPLYTAMHQSGVGRPAAGEVRPSIGSVGAHAVPEPEPVPVPGFSGGGFGHGLGLGHGSPVPSDAAAALGLGAGLDLAYALARQAEDLADVAQGQLVVL